jgi:hypothetical protein
VLLFILFTIMTGNKKTENPLILFEDEKFKCATVKPNTRSCYINISLSNKSDNHTHPFINLDYSDDDVDRRIVYNKSPYYKWDKYNTNEFWKITSAINWCYGDIYYDDYDFKSVEQWIEKSQVHVETMVILCTGYYYYTQKLYELLTPYFEKYNLTYVDRYAVVSHIAVLGKEWYDLLIDDITVVKPIIKTGNYVNFHQYLLGLKHDYRHYIAYKK